MKFISSVLLALSAKALNVRAELPVTTSDVFVQSGEVSDSSAVIMVRCNNEVDSAVSITIDGGATARDTQAFAAHDFTVSVHVTGLEANKRYAYSARCAPLDGSAAADSMSASFKTAPSADDDSALSFVWVGDLSGQGWGRNPDFEITTVDGRTVKGGYVVFDLLERLEPDFALFQGDMIYADGALPPSKAIPTALGGGTWINNPSYDVVATTLEEFRGHWKYNHGDDKFQSFLAKTPIFVQWDDHEVANNWYPGEVLSGLFAPGTAADGLWAESLQAFYEFNPIMEGASIYRSQRFGKHLEVFFVDFRSFRGPNYENSDPEPLDMLGPEQLEWLKEGLANSDATWKIISSHDPLGIVTGGPGDYDSYANQAPEILGREFELQDLLGFIHNREITNVVSLTTDVHFTAHVSLDPSRAEGGWTDFEPLHEFVVGPMHAGSFGPNYMDTSFGAMYEYEMGPLTLGYERWANLPPTEHRLQSFGHAAVDEDGVLTVKLITITGEVLYEKTMTPSSVCKGRQLKGGKNKGKGKC